MILILQATSLSADGTHQELLSIKPSFCILGEQDERCDSVVELEWTIDSPGLICIHSNQQVEALACIHTQRQGSYQFSLVTDKTIHFYLRDYATGNTLATVNLQVVFQQQRYRSSRHNPWNFF